MSQFKDGQVYNTRCPICLEPTSYQLYRYDSTDLRNFKCQKCGSSSPYLSWFTKEADGQ